MKRKRNILFICKANIFRSRVAEAVFNTENKLNKNTSWKAKSAGIISMNKLVPIIERDIEIILMERKLEEENGINVTGRPKKVNKKLLNWADTIIIVADDIPLDFLKRFKKTGKKLIIWDVSDAKNKKEIEKTIKEIKKRVSGLAKEIKIPTDPESRGIFNPTTENDSRGRAQGYSAQLKEIR